MGKEDLQTEEGEREKTSKEAERATTTTMTKSSSEEKSTYYRHLFRKVGQASLFTVRAASVEWKSIRDVPLKRRLQTFFVLCWLGGLALVPLLVLPLTLFIIFGTPLSLFMVSSSCNCASSSSSSSLTASLIASRATLVSNFFTHIRKSLLSFRLGTLVGYSSSTSRHRMVREEDFLAGCQHGSTSETTFQ